MMAAPVDELGEIARRVRRHILLMAATPEGCHLGGSMSIVEILVALYFRTLRVDPDAPSWPERDVFVLSKGHAAAALYAVLAERGFFPTAELPTYGQAAGRLAGHPLPSVPGVEFATGSLGHGLALGAGVALADRRAGRPSRTFVLLGDGELQEGSVWEAARAASKLRLESLTAIVDINGLQINGRTRDDAGELAARWRAFGWTAVEEDGHDLKRLIDRFQAVPFVPGCPSLLLARTIKAKGVSRFEHRAQGHYVRLHPDEIAVEAG